MVTILAVIALGYLLQAKGWFKEGFSKSIADLILNIALPASIFVSVLKYLTLKSLLSLTGALVYTFLSVIIGYIFAYILEKIKTLFIFLLVVSIDFYFFIFFIFLVTF